MWLPQGELAARYATREGHVHHQWRADFRHLWRIREHPRGECLRPDVQRDLLGQWNERRLEYRSGYADPRIGNVPPVKYPAVLQYEELRGFLDSCPAGIMRYREEVLGRRINQSDLPAQASLVDV